MQQRRKKRWLAAALVFALLLTGCIWQYVLQRIDAGRYPAPGSYVNTGAYELHYVSKGDGETAIVFISGSGTPCAYTDFYLLQESLSAYGQTICFDHAGTGWSSGTTEPRTAEKLEAELTALLDAAAPGKRVILVCHSLGALEAIYFAQTNPEKVRGIVFLDTGAPEFYRADSELTAKAMNRALALARTVGLIRLLCNAGIPMPVYGESSRLKQLPAEIADIDRAMLCRYAGSGETWKSVDAMNENAKAVLDGPRPGSLPILVLSSDSGDAWEKVQHTLAEWSENGRQLTIEHAEHYLHWSNPDAVEEEMIRFIGEIKDIG